MSVLPYYLATLLPYYLTTLLPYYLTQGSAHTAAPEAARDLFLTAATDGCVHLWDLRTAARARSFAAHLNRAQPVGCAFSPCLRYVACGSEDKQAYRYRYRYRYRSPSRVNICDLLAYT